MKQRELDQEHKDYIKSTIHEITGIVSEDILDDDRLKEDLGLHSLDLIDTVIQIEKAFNMMIPDNRVEKIETVQDLYDLSAEYIHPSQPKIDLLHNDITRCINHTCGKKNNCKRALQLEIDRSKTGGHISVSAFVEKDCEHFIEHKIIK